MPCLFLHETNRHCNAIWLYSTALTLSVPHTSVDLHKNTICQTSPCPAQQPPWITLCAVGVMIAVQAPDLIPIFARTCCLSSCHHLHWSQHSMPDWGKARPDCDNAVVQTIRQGRWSRGPMARLCAQPRHGQYAAVPRPYSHCRRARAYGISYLTIWYEQ